MKTNSIIHLFLIGFQMILWVYAFHYNVSITLAISSFGVGLSVGALLRTYESAGHL